MSDSTKMITISACGEERSFPAGTVYKEIAFAFADKIPYPILLVRKNGNELRELTRVEGVEDTQEPAGLLLGIWGAVKSRSLTL